MAPFVDVKTVNGREVLDGFMPHILKSVSQWMNLELTYVREPFDMYGRVENNMSATGMIGMLQRNEVDLILNAIQPKEEYLEFAYFTNPITTEAFTIISGKRTQEAGLFLYFSALGEKVWLGLFITLVVLSIATGTLLKTESRDLQSWSVAIGRSFWNLISSMFKQVISEKWLLRKNGKRSSYFLPLLALLWSLFVSLMLMSVFQSLLVSKLTLSKSSPSVNSLVDVTRSSSHFCLVPRGIMFQEVLQKANTSLTLELLRKIDFDYPQNTLFSFESIEKIEEGKRCVIHGQLVVSSILSEYFKKKGRCNLHISRETFFPFTVLMAIHKKFPPDFYNTFNLGITRLVDADISGRWFRQARREAKLCTGYSEYHLKPLGLENLMGVLLIWMSGIILSSVSFLIECLFYKLKEHV